MCLSVFYPPLANYKSIACILIPLTSEFLRLIRDSYACPCGGLKGQMAPGDAHPYLAPFGFYRKLQNCMAGVLMCVSDKCINKFKSFRNNRFLKLFCFIGTES